MQTFMETLREQRWDDHRYYHHHRINQSLHLFSSLCFIAVYVLLFTQPVYAAMIGWIVAMVSRQVGHFFIEPKGYDEINQASHEYKESVKVGYNLRRKVILLTLWALTPLVLYASPTFFGVFEQTEGHASFLERLSKLWIVLGIGAVVFRTIHLFVLKDVKTGLAWFTKILTDPFHDVTLYYRAPLQALRGEMLAPREKAHPHDQSRSAA